ncbi:TPA: hypothetical protein MYN98_004317 [Klebsiella quasipneumoniae subsp. similipneumoniae]|uniref:hypothetical protein n=1 Tax=Klebsiella TaxID=570 RepID=UPI000B3E50D4|nr:hypothetical protein [Klebsiella pneumoniae]HCB1306233.1 hypothetical protein [Klebsiella quasipneumoniae subsp. similipneumoniae]HCD2265372.1 hypothetical protein [Klebsiella quasipneumoniae]HDU3945212.1 hypothetical protein [Klebsiella pneumoniae subsp. pneumoniae]OUY27263.1 hypothetical protein BLK90_18385 [Klebsiella pneumoniae]HBX6943554.1 hypothetical protein [Klebsiella pneumoniae]
MKESITKVAMVLALALSGITHESCAKEAVSTHHIVASGVGSLSNEEVMSSIRQIQDVTAEGRKLYASLDALADIDFEAAKAAAEVMRADIIGALAIAEFLFQALPDVSVIRTFPKDSLRYKLCRAVAEARHNAKNLDDLLNQILSVSPNRETHVNPDALVQLAKLGTEAAAKWH